MIGYISLKHKENIQQEVASQLLWFHSRARPQLACVLQGYRRANLPNLRSCSAPASMCAAGLSSGQPGSMAWGLKRQN